MKYPGISLLGNRVARSLSVGAGVGVNLPQKVERFIVTYRKT